jgi:uncharacterized protein (DUF305 family)
MAKLCTLAMFVACSQERQSDADKLTPWDSLVAANRSRQGVTQRNVDTVRPDAVPIKTGNADHDFLRAMSNHHKSVIVLADAALEVNNRPEMEDVIRQVEERHGHELDAMTGILRKTYNDRFISSPSVETKLTADVLRRSVSGYRRIFLDAAIKAEGEAVRTIDFYLPRAERMDTERLAKKMKSEESQDILVLRKRLATGNQR